VREYMGENPDLRIRTMRDATEKYGRWLGVVWHYGDVGSSLNDLLLQDGHAVPYTP
jgi:endonuclease YncB( thermonuclease family)